MCRILIIKQKNGDTMKKMNKILRLLLALIGVSSGALYGAQSRVAFPIQRSPKVQSFHTVQIVMNYDALQRGRAIIRAMPIFKIIRKNFDAGTLCEKDIQSLEEAKGSAEDMVYALSALFHDGFGLSIGEWLDAIGDATDCEPNEKLLLAALERLLKLILGPNMREILRYSGNNTAETVSQEDLLNQDPTKQDPLGNTALLRELLKEHPDLDVMGNLLGREKDFADPNVINKAGESPLFVLVRKEGPQRKYDMAYTLKFGACADAKTWALALAKRDIEAVGLLGAQHAFFDAIDRNDEKRAMQLLGTWSIDPKAKDAKGDTALHRAVFVGENLADVISELLMRGADPQALNAEGFTPLHVATERDKFWRGLACQFKKGYEDEKERYFVEWLRVRLQHPFEYALTFEEDYVKDGKKGRAKVTYFSPRWPEVKDDRPIGNGYLPLRSRFTKGIRPIEDSFK